MSNLKQWALEYVLSDDETAQLEITKKAASGGDFLRVTKSTNPLDCCLLTFMHRNREFPGEQHSGWELGRFRAAMDDPG